MNKDEMQMTIEDIKEKVLPMLKEKKEITIPVSLRAQELFKNFSGTDMASLTLTYEDVLGDVAYLERVLQNMK